MIIRRLLLLSLLLFIAIYFLGIDVNFNNPENSARAQTPECFADCFCVCAPLIPDGPDVAQCGQSAACLSNPDPDCDEPPPDCGGGGSCKPGNPLCAVTPTQPAPTQPAPTQPTPTQAPLPTCSEQGGSCMPSCSGGDSNLGTGYSDCGGWYCCVPSGSPASMTINGIVFEDVNRNRLRDPGEAIRTDINVTLTDYISGYVVNTDITDALGYSFSDLPVEMYTVTISLPVNYEVVGGSNIVNVFELRSRTVDFPIAPFSKSLNNTLLIIADTGTSAITQESYGLSGLRTDDPLMPKGSNLYNAIKATQRVRVADPINLNKVSLIGISFGNLGVPGTLFSLKTLADNSGGFVLLYALKDVSNSMLGGPQIGTEGCLYNFCSQYYYLYFKGQWYARSARTTAGITIDKSGTGIKIIANRNNNSYPVIFPGNINVPFTIYFYNSLVSGKYWATYGYIYDTDGLQTVVKQRACDRIDGTGNCTSN